MLARVVIDWLKNKACLLFLAVYLSSWVHHIDERLTLFSGTAGCISRLVESVGKGKSSVV